MAIDHPGTVAASSPRAPSRASPTAGVAEFVRSEILTLGDQVPRALAESFQSDTIAGPAAPGLLETTWPSACARRRRPGAAPSRGCWRTISAQLHKVEVPVLLPWGDADAFSRESDQQRLDWQLPLTTRAVYAGVGDALHWETPALRGRRGAVRQSLVGWDASAPQRPLHVGAAGGEPNLRGQVGPRKPYCGFARADVGCGFAQEPLTAAGCWGGLRPARTYGPRWEGPPEREQAVRFVKSLVGWAA